MSWRRRAPADRVLRIGGTIAVLGIVLVCCAVVEPCVPTAGAGAPSGAHSRVSTQTAQPFVGSPTYSTLSEANGHEELWSIRLEGGPSR